MLEDRNQTFRLKTLKSVKTSSNVQKYVHILFSSERGQK